MDALPASIPSEGAADGARDGAIPLLRLDDPLAERRRVAHASMMIEVEQETMEKSCPGFLVTANTGEVVARSSWHDEGVAWA